MADDPEEKLVGLSMFPKVPNYEPDISTKQSLWVRYGASPRSSLTREGWTLSKSEQQFNIDASAEVNLNMIPPSARGRRPERISLQICDAPGSFALPLKVKKQVKPNFRVCFAFSWSRSRLPCSSARIIQHYGLVNVGARVLRCVTFTCAGCGGHRLPG